MVWGLGVQVSGVSHQAFVRTSAISPGRGSAIVEGAEWDVKSWGGTAWVSRKSASRLGSSSPSSSAVPDAVPVRVSVPPRVLVVVPSTGLRFFDDPDFEFDDPKAGVDPMECRPAKLGEASLTE